MSYKDSISGISVRVTHKEKLPYGNGSKGRLIEPEKGRRSIFVPSWGSMEKEEIDYVVEVAQEQEDERIQSKKKSQLKVNIENLTQAAMQAPPGERAKTVRELRDGGRWI